MRYRVTVCGDPEMRVVEAMGWDIREGGVLVFIGGELYGMVEAFAPGQWLHVERIAE